MKKPISLLLLACLVITGCNLEERIRHKLNPGQDHLNEILKTLADLGVEEKDLFVEMAENLDGGEGDYYYSELVHTDYKSKVSRDRVVVGLLDSDGDESSTYLGLDLAGYHAVLNDTQGMDDATKTTALKDYMKSSTSTLNKIGTVFYDENGQAFSESSESKKDLESLGAQVELRNTKAVADRLATNFGLSESRSEKVAKLVSQYTSLSTKRSLSDKEKDFFSQELLGIEYKDVISGMKSEGSEVNDLFEKAAKTNNTSVEQMKAIINEIFL